MGRIVMAAAAAAGALSLGGCLDLTGSLQGRPAAAAVAGAGAGLAATAGPATTAAPWSMPGRTALTATDEIVTTFVPARGFVRGTRAALAELGQPLTPAPGVNRIQACRAAVRAEAEKLGAREVEAVSAGPDQRNDKGQLVGPMRVRIIYAHGLGFDVRDATMTCVVDRHGKVVGSLA